MRTVLSVLIFAAVPTLALAHGHGGLPPIWGFPLPIWPGHPAPAPELAAGLPAAAAAVAAVVATRFKRRG